MDVLLGQPGDRDTAVGAPPTGDDGRVVRLPSQPPPSRHLGNLRQGTVKTDICVF